MRQYVASFLMQPSFIGALRELHAFERSRRYGESRSAPQASWKGSPSAAAVGIDTSDPHGRNYLPLTEAAHPSNALVRSIRSLVNASMFESFILLCILLSSASLAVDMPSVLPGSPTAKMLATLDVVFTLIFTLEMCFKLIAVGPFSHPDGYFLNWWNILDSMIVATSILSLVAHNDSLSVLRAMRALRALRPLRVIRRLSGLKKVVNSLFRAIPQVHSLSPHDSDQPSPNLDPSYPWIDEGHHISPPRHPAGHQCRSGVHARDGGVRALWHAVPDGPDGCMHRPIHQV